MKELMHIHRLALRPIKVYTIAFSIILSFLTLRLAAYGAKLELCPAGLKPVLHNNKAWLSIALARFRKIRCFRIPIIPEAMVGALLLYVHYQDQDTLTPSYHAQFEFAFDTSLSHGFWRGLKKIKKKHSAL